jgi:hypothetical protein
MAKLNLNSLMLNARLNANCVADRMGSGFALVVATPAVPSHQMPSEPCAQPQLGRPVMPQGYRDQTPIRAGRSDGLAGGYTRRGLDTSRLTIAKRWSGIASESKCLSVKQLWFALNLAELNASAQGVR